MHTEIQVLENDCIDQLPMLARYEGQINRTYERAFKQLQILQSARQALALAAETAPRSEPLSIAKPPTPQPIRPTAPPLQPESKPESNPEPNVE